ncbi:MAG: ABC transporter substrate-binding protein [Nocardioidaceae bacterium]
MRRRNRDRAKVTLGLVAASTLLAACSGADGASGGDELRVLVSAQDDKAAEQKVWFSRLEKEFRAKTGATLTFETFSSAEEEQKKIQTGVISGTGPDVFSLGTTFTPVAQATGGFLELSKEDWEKIGGRDRFAPEALAMSGTDPSHEVGVPVSMRPYALAYNTELFRKAGIDGPPTTWDELLQDAKKINAPSEGVYGLAVDYADEYNPWKYIWTLAELSGGSLVSEDLKQSQLDSTQVVEATQDYFDLLTKHGVVDPASAGWENDQAVAAFAAGKAGILPLVTPSMVPTLESSALEGKYDVAPMPMVPFGAQQLPPGGVPAGTIVSGDNLAIADYTDNKDLALEYLKMVTSTEKQLQYARMFGDVPANQEAAEVYSQGTPAAAAFAEANNTAVPTAYTGAWADVQLGLTNVMTQSLPALAEGRYDPATVEQLLREADRTVQSSLARQK